MHMVLAAGKPWVVVPEWRYFDEQFCKAEVLDREGLAVVSRHWPSYAQAWEKLWTAARMIDVGRQRAIIDPNSAQAAATWLNDLCRDLWAGTGQKPSLEAVA